MGLENFLQTRPESKFQDCSKHISMASMPKEAMNGLQTVIQHAIIQKGVAVLGIPRNVASDEIEDVYTAGKNFHAEPRIIPSEEHLNELASIINSYEKVKLFCGHGFSYAIDEVMQLAAKLNSPLVYSFRGKIFFERRYKPFAVGLNGLLVNKSGFEAMHKSDVLVMLGTDFPDSEFLPKKCKIVQIDTKPGRLGRRGIVDYGYCGDIKSTIKELLPIITKKSSTDFLDKMRIIHEEVEEKYDTYVKEKGK